MKELTNAQAIKSFMGFRTVDTNGNHVDEAAQRGLFMKEFKALSKEEKQWFGDQCRLALKLIAQ